MFKKCLITAVIALAPLSALAATLNFGDYFLKGAQNAPDDVYVAGETAVFAGSVSGDAVALGRTIFSQSEISGDIFFIGEEVHVEGKSGDDVRALGGVVTIDGTITDDVVAIGSKVLIAQTALIEGSLYVVAGSAEILGKVQGDVNVLSNKLLFSGTVEGDFELWGKGTFKEPARIGGDFIQHTSGKTESPVNVTITGEIIRSEWKHNGVSFGQAALGGFFSLKVLMMLALGFLLFFLARERTEEVLLETLSNFWPRVLRGFLILLLLPILIPILLLSVIGIPIAFLVAALLLLLLLLSWVYGGILLGAWAEQIFFKRSAFPLTYRPVLLGIVFVAVVSGIPIVGPVIHGVLLLGTAGSLGTIFWRKIRVTVTL